MPEQTPLKDPRFRGKRYEITLDADDPRRTQESAEACAEKIAVVESLMTDFENTHDLKALHAITGFTSREARANSSRRPAAQALIPIFEKLKYLSSQEAVPNQKYIDLQARYLLLNRAVGVVTRDPAGIMFDLVVHDR